MKTLVAIANFGTKNNKYVNRVLEEYRSMTRYKVDVVVLSNIPKNLGSDVEVIVGLPTKNPWSLPFGYKNLFVDRMRDYDLFIYSEDDTLITERNIDAFVKVQGILPDKYIAGFIRYEISENGTKYYSTIHSHYHWDPNSVFDVGEYVFAHYTNEHSACFILTQGQLEKAIASRGFLLPPRIGRYDMLCTAATDPYTQCGMKKVICISHIDDFCLHHLPNVYYGRIGLNAELADREIKKLKSLCGMNTVRGPLFDTTTLLEENLWDKRYYETPRMDILSLVPKGVRRVLSVGCGCGSTESELVKQGVEVVGIPLDCVIQVGAEARGIRVLSPSFNAAKEELRGEQFDMILFPDVLQHLPEPIAKIREFLDLLGKNGHVIISVPNFHHLSVVKMRILGKFRIPMTTNKHSYEKYRLHFTVKNMLYDWLTKCGLQVVEACHQVEPRHELLDRFTLGILKEVMSENIVVLAKRYVV